MSTSTPGPSRQPLTGVGLGLRWSFLDDLLARLESVAVPFWEISPENYMRRGGYIPTSLEKVAARSPIITHGLQMSLGGTDPFEEKYFREVRELLGEVKTPWHSDHLCFCGVDGRILHDLLPMPQTEAAARHVAARVREARDRLGVPMAVENISFYLKLGAPDMPEVEFVSRVLDEADCGMLLDVNNVYVNAQNHGFDPRAWIDQIDLDRVWQIHVAGHEYRPADDLIVDTHGADVIDPVLDLLAHTIERKGPVAVILERDNEVPPLDALLAERERVSRAYERGLSRWHASRQDNAPEAAADPAQKSA
jgi:uncharacterized protein